MTGVELARSEFASIVGESRVVSDVAACASLAVDGKAPKSVVYPSSAEQVAAVLKCAAELGRSVIPCRNGTKLGVGGPPRSYDVALSLKEMNRVWHYEPADLTVSVEAGMKLGDFQHFVGRRGLWLPLDPTGGPRASIGGILATNSAGPLRIQYGAPRDLVLGMKIATTEGKVIKTGGRVVKNVAGYDLGKLLIGSYGTLGVIAEASLKLFPLPLERATFVLASENLGIARNLRRRISQSPLQPMRMSLLDPTASTLARASTALAADVHALEMWVEFGASPRVIERCAQELEALGHEGGASIERVDRQAADLLWSRISGFHAWLAEAHPDLIILKVTLPAAASEEFLLGAQQDAQNTRLGFASFGQTSVGILQLCLWGGEGSAPVPALISRLRAGAVQMGGALIVEKCAPEVKARVDVWGPAGDDFEMMRKLKFAWDPKGILSPGRFLAAL